ncbi:RNA-binding protein, putative [Plasmodium vinckei]|uniref:RNA-binding protein, putative n=1 Tax=Plasmodium vinckei TaxID=5860 RepID=A0A6V7SU80_PLAVN|nr:RNA-binding protein, putative [Plasmodium vinckei]
MFTIRWVDLLSSESNFLQSSTKNDNISENLKNKKLPYEKEPDLNNSFLNSYNADLDNSNVGINLKLKNLKISDNPGKGENDDTEKKTLISDTKNEVTGEAEQTKKNICNDGSVGNINKTNNNDKNTTLETNKNGNKQNLMTNLEHEIKNSIPNNAEQNNINKIKNNNINKDEGKIGKKINDKNIKHTSKELNTSEHGDKNSVKGEGHSLTKLKRNSIGGSIKSGPSCSVSRATSNSSMKRNSYNIQKNKKNNNNKKDIKNSYFSKYIVEKKKNNEKNEEQINKNDTNLKDKTNINEPSVNENKKFSNLLTMPANNLVGTLSKGKKRKERNIDDQTSMSKMNCTISHDVEVDENNIPLNPTKKMKNKLKNKTNNEINFGNENATPTIYNRMNYLTNQLQTKINKENIDLEKFNNFNNNFINYLGDIRNNPIDSMHSVNNNRVNSRLKEIAVGKSTKEYKNYVKLVKYEDRMDDDPATPNAYENITNAKFQAKYNLWRKKLHKFDTIN